MNRIYSRRCETDGYVDTMNNYERRNISFSRLLTSISTIHRLTIPRIERSPPSIILGTRYSRYRFFFHNKSSIKKGGKFIYNLGLYIGNSQCSNNNLNRNLNRVWEDRSITFDVWLLCTQRADCKLYIPINLLNDP